MSRIGKQPIEIPDSVTINVEKKRIQVKGPKGELTIEVPVYVLIENSDGSIIVRPDNEENKHSRSLWGTYQRLISNMITGVTEGFTKVLSYSGVGWRMEVKNKRLIMNLGYSHPIGYRIPDDIEIALEKNLITISGIEKQKVGQVAAEIRAFRKPEPYKGKGIKYQDEVIRRKAGKQAKGTA